MQTTGRSTSSPSVLTSSASRWTTRLLPLATVLLATPAFACGGPRLSSAQMGILMVSMAAAPLLAAFLVDRGAFALAGYAFGLKRKHQPTAVGPVLAVAAVAISLGSMAMHNLDMAVIGFGLVPVAAAICGLSFLRSVIIEQRGNRRAQLLRVGAIFGFGLLAMARFAF